MAYLQANRRNTGRMPAAPSRRLGTWKLAYADFLTALVAFFIVMWLVKGFPESGREELAGFFRQDAGASEMTYAQSGSETTERLAARIADSLSEHELVHRHAGTVHVVAEGSRVRIDVSDQTRDPVFHTGDSTLTPYGEATLAELGDVLADSPWPLEIEGHTDAFPFAGESGSNWSLSAQRAEQARRILSEHGISRARIHAVTGRADSLPLHPREPHHPSNRRVTVILKVTK